MWHWLSWRWACQLVGGCTWATTLLPVVLGQSFLIDLWHSKSCPCAQAMPGWAVADCCSVCSTGNSVHPRLLLCTGTFLVAEFEEWCECQRCVLLLWGCHWMLGREGTHNLARKSLFENRTWLLFIFNILDLFIFCLCIFSHEHSWLLQELWGTMKNPVFFTFAAPAEDGTET